MKNSEKAARLVHMAEVNDIQREILDTFFNPMEASDSLPGWEEIFEKALFMVGQDAISHEYVQYIYWYYQLLKHVRRLSEYAYLEDPDEIIN